MINRPSIVMSSEREPILGWTETISAMGGVVFAVTLGLIQYLHSNAKMVVDIVPVDTVSNLILASTAYIHY